MAKVYTRTGDDGTTGTFKGDRVSKDDELMESIGTVDELNSFLGLLDCKLGQKLAVELGLKSIQSRLFDLGGAMGCIYNEPQFNSLVEKIDPEELELEIDKLDQNLPEIKQFILPGGNEPACLAHVCRSVCRRAERRMVSLANREFERNDSEMGQGFQTLLKYVNRLSDYLFVLARHLNHGEQNEEIFWTA